MKRKTANVKRQTADEKPEMVRVVLDPAVRTVGTIRVSIEGRIYTLTHKAPVDVPKADFDTMIKRNYAVVEKK